MKYLFILALVLYINCAFVNGSYILRDRGEDGKEMWAKNHTVMEGKDLTLFCISQPKRGKKAQLFFWQIMKRKIGTKKYPKATFVSPNSRGRITITRPHGVDPSLIKNSRDIRLKNIERDASGTYSCAVITLVSTKPKRKFYAEVTYQNVVVKAGSRIESTMKTDIQLQFGDTLSLDCTSSGYPKPRITWSRVDGRPLPHRTITHDKGLFSISNVGQRERGKYKCLSSNAYGNDTKIFNVQITVPATIVSSRRAYATIGKDGFIQCVAIGVPRPTFSWKWYEGRLPETLSSEVRKMNRFEMRDEHYFENSTSTLIIKDVQREDLRIYMCVAENSRSVKQKIALVGYSVPDRPVIVTVAVQGTSITIGWRHGESDGGKPITSIIIEYTKQSNITQWKQVTVKEPRSVRHTIRDLEPQTRYMLRVIAVNEIGPSSPSASHFVKTNLGKTVKTNAVSTGISTDITKERFIAGQKNSSWDMTKLVGGLTGGGFLVLIIAIVVVCILMRNMQRNSAKKAAENEERAKNAKQDPTAALLNYIQNGGERLSSTGSGGCMGNSGEALQLTTCNKWEFPRERLVLQNILGSGAFGIVMKAEAEGINGYNSGVTPVAVKFVKENESASAKKDLIAELELLKLIEPHKNVINLLGCCTRSEPLMVIVEFCAYGDLQSFLRSSRGIRDQYYLECYKRPSSRLTSKELLMFGTQIAKGMAHLACLKVIHRDLAARNILVDENKVCKVSDFGFARDIYVEDHYTRKTAGGRFPIKWMAIESLLDGISTTKSDVWSFAIVLWEIITLGASPYPGMNSQEVVSFLQNGMRMDKPKHCSDELYNLLLDCWQVASHRRPNFEMLARYLDRMCNDDFEYINMRTYDDHLYINFDGNTMSEGSNSATLMKQDSNSQNNSGDSLVEKDACDARK